MWLSEARTRTSVQDCAKVPTPATCMKDFSFVLAQTQLITLHTNLKRNNLTSQWTCLQLLALLLLLPRSLPAHA